jgi:hypothetical protein
LPPLPLESVLVAPGVVDCDYTIGVLVVVVACKVDVMIIDINRGRATEVDAPNLAGYGVYMTYSRHVELTTVV